MRNIVALLPVDETADYHVVNADSVCGDKVVAGNPAKAFIAGEFALQAGEANFTHYAWDGNHAYLAALEPPTVRNAAHPLAFVANEIATMLHHGCALAPEEACELPSIRALQAAWVARGIANNDTMVAAGQRQFAGNMEGWAVDDEGNLHHETAGGRMRVKVAGDITLTISSWPEGEDQPCDAAELHIGLAWDYNSERYELEVQPPTFADEKLLEDKPSRLSLIWQLDRQLGGEIRKSLRVAADQRLGFYGQKEAAVIVAALKVIDEQEAAG